MKKTLALLLAVAMMFSTVTVAFAQEEISAEAKACVALGMLQGEGPEGVDAVYVATTPTRLQAAIMFLRLKGLEQTAIDYTATKNFVDADKITWADGKKILGYLYENPQLGFAGVGNDKFDPTANMTGNAYYKVVLTALGYVQGVDFEWANVAEFAATKGLTAVANDVDFTVADLATATVEGLKATTKADTTLVSALMAAGTIKEDAAIAAGLYVKPVVIVDVKSAVALTSKVVEVTLNTAATAVDAKTITVKDAAGTAVAVTGAEIAAYDTANKTVLVTLGTDTTAGTLYTLTSGAKSVNFGGKAVDSKKPAIDSITVNDYNEIAVKFTEPVQLNGATFEITEKYGSKAALAVSGIKYDGKDTILIATAEQKASTLYGITVTGVKDFTGNVMDKDDAKTFVGKGKLTDTLVVNKAKANDYNEVAVEFNVNVDPATIAAGNFKIEEAYGTKATVEVTAAKLAVEDDKDASGATIATDADGRKTVILTVGALKDATLYKVTVSGMKTLYGKDMSTTSADNNKTFVGQAKASTVLKFGATPAASGSNTTVTVSFLRKVDKATAENLANYVITEAYGTKAAVAVTAAALQTNGTDVKLTVAPMKNVLYKMVVTNIVDVYGNKLDTASSYNEITFVGAQVADKVKNIVGITRVGDTVIRVEFDQKVGANANDVSVYTIDGGIGYPEKAVKSASTVANYQYKVDLTIPKTTAGKVFKLTVKGLTNADGVAMGATDELTKTFVGQGLDATKATVEAVFAVDAQTLKVYFDRPVTENTIDGIIWNSSNGTLVAGALGVSVDGGTTVDKDLAATGGAEADAKVWKDFDNANVLVIRTDAGVLFDATTSTATGDLFKLIAASTKVVSTDSKNILDFGYNNTAVAKPELINVIANDSRTLTAYFSEPVKMNATPTDFNIYTAENNATAPTGGIDVTNAYPVRTVTPSGSAYSTQWTLKLNADLLTTLANVTAGKAFIQIADTSAHVTDMSGYVMVKPNTDKAYRAVEFGIVNTLPNATKISSIYAVMTDKRTIDVYYPEAMSSSLAGDATKYALTDSTGDVAATVVAFSTVTGANAYSATTNKTTLFLDGNIETALVSGVTPAKYYLAINSAITNLAGTNTVKDDVADLDAFGGGTVPGLVLEIAPSTTAVEKPVISSAVVADDNMSVAVTFSQKVKMAAGTNFNAVDTLTAAQVDQMVKMTAQFTGEGAVGAVATSEIAYGQLDSAHTVLTVYFVKSLVAGSAGTVTTEGATAGQVVNRQGVAALVDSDASEVAFAAKTSLFGDVAAPVMVSAKTIANDKIEITYSETVANNGLVPTQYVVDLDGVAGGELTTSTVTVSGNVVTITLSTAPFLTTVADADATITYTQDGTAANRTVDGAGNYAGSAQTITGLAAGY